MKNIVLLAGALAAASMQAATVTWNGRAGDGKWETGGNWDTGAMPTSADVVKFGEPYAGDITVTISETVHATEIQTSSSRTGTVTLQGNGLLVFDSAYVRHNGYGALVFDVDVTNAVSDTTVTAAYGDTTFRRRLVNGGGSTLAIRNNSTLRLLGNATAASKYLNMHGYTNPSLLLAENSSLTIDRDITLNPDATLSVSGSASLSLRNLYADPDASISFTGGSIVVSNAVTHPMLLAANPGTYLESRLNGDNAFAPFSETVDEWVMHGGTVVNKAGNSSDGWNRFDLMGLTNATRTISGSGTLKVGRFYTKNSSNLLVRINGPDVYLRQLSQSGYGTDIRLQVGGGSTLGYWNTSAPSLENLTPIISGNASFDTTDNDDGTTGQTITVGQLGASDGVLTVKGLGQVTLSRSMTQPNLGITVRDSATVKVSSGVAVYALADLVLTDDAKMTTPYYLGHKDNVAEVVKSLSMDGNTTLEVGRYMRISGGAALSGRASAVIRHTSSGDAEPSFECTGLSLSDDASLVVTGQVAAASLFMSGNAHLAFTAGTAFTTDVAFGDGGWTMEITIPSDYEAGIRPIVKGAEFGADFVDHVTLAGDTAGWEVMVLEGTPVLYKPTAPSGIEWTGGSASSDNWSDQANWNGGNVPTADDFVTFGGLTRPEPFDDCLSAASGIVFRASAGPFCVTGSVESLSLTANAGGRSSATAGNAAILSYSGFDQTIALPVDFGPSDAYVLAAGGGAIELPAGLTQTDNWHYLLVGGDVRVGGECSVGILSFIGRHSNGVNPRLTLLPGCSFLVRHQYWRSFSEESYYPGSIVIEEGAVMTVQDGDCCFFHPAGESVVDGTLIVKGSSDSGRLVATQNEQHYVGKGTIYADSARAGRNPEAANHYINFGGTLKLYMNGNWWTATYAKDSSVMQNPNYPTRFRMTDGTTLGATKDWFHGPRTDAGKEAYTADHPATITPAERTSVMTGTVTVDTLDPVDGATAHTITFVDPLDASAASVVKVGAGTLAFGEPAGYHSQFGSLTVSGGAVRFGGADSPALGDLSVADGATASFASVPTLSGTLTLSAGAEFQVDGVATTREWELLAVADAIVGPGGAEKWQLGMRRYKVVDGGGVMNLYGGKVSGVAVILR